MVRRINFGNQSFAQELDALLAYNSQHTDSVDETVKTVLSAISEQGDEALFKYTRQFDKFDIDVGNMQVSAEEVAAARETICPHLLASIEKAASRIEAYHRPQLPRDEFYEDSEGVQLGVRWTPLSSVGVYVPGGSAAYPSTVLMNVVPARVAGVGRVVMVVPAPCGFIDPVVLVAADVAEVDAVFKVGGAQAIGALAYGTSSIPSVDKIVGPGNIYVATAKKQVFGHVGIDMIAGPSEIVVIADEENDPKWIAADLLAQAEHDAAAQSILITNNSNFADQVEKEVDRCLSVLERSDIASKSWHSRGAIICVSDLETVGPLIDRIAPEHLEIALSNPMTLLDTFSHAGAIFLGRYTPEAIGDYVAGPSHVLPTAQSARYASGLSVLDFLKRSSIIGCSKATLDNIGSIAVDLAQSEGLSAHALSVSMRLSSSER